MSRVLVVPGSLRRDSYSRMLARSLGQYAPEGLELEVFDLHGVPPFDADVETDGYPPRVAELRESIADSNGLILVTPEYNGSMSGVIKNAIDWASRKGLLARRPVTVISGSDGALGATKAQAALRSVLDHLGMYVLGRPSLAIPRFDQKLKDDRIVDEGTERLVRDWLAAFAVWVGRFE